VNLIIPAISLSHGSSALACAPPSTRAKNKNTRCSVVLLMLRCNRRITRAPRRFRFQGVIFPVLPNHIFWSSTRAPRRLRFH
jgi:hypothetical protein